MSRTAAARAAALVGVLGMSAAAAAAAPSIRLNPMAPPSAAAPASPVANDPRLEALAARLRTALDRRPVRGTSVTIGQLGALAQLNAQSGSGLEVHFRTDAGTPRLVRGGVLENAAPGAGAGRDENTARAFLRRQRQLLRLEDPDVEMALERIERDGLGRRHVRFAQTRAGLPVWPANLIVHLDAAGRVDSMDGAYVPSPRLPTTDPAVTADEALLLAQRAIGAEGAAPSGGAGLVVYAPGDRAPRLAWQLSIPTNVATRWLVVVDALDGTVLTAFDEVPDVNVQGSGIDLFGARLALNVWSEDALFYLVDTSKPMYDASSDPPDPDTTRGGIVVLDAANQPPNNSPQGIPPLAQITSRSATTWPLPDGVSAAASLADVYDYYFMRHGRNSIDGNGGSLLAIVRLGQGYHNAFWSGSYMAFGDAEPYPGSVDAVGHELTHGVTQYSANLIYRDESGALNEAFSDIFGESVEAFVMGGPDWQVGSRLSAPLRDMSDPHRFGDPATYSERVVTSDDNGGVHTNSGILNHAYYLLVEGLDGGGIGIGDAERIFYRALTVHLVANSRYIDARLAAVASARELFGEGSRQAERTGAAFDAVEVFAGRGTPSPQPFPGVAGEDATLFLYYDAAQDSYLLGRREHAQHDDDGGVQLVPMSVTPTRPSVAGDGSFAVFVDANNDICLASTDGSPIDPNDSSPVKCLGFPGLVSASAVAPDGGQYGFVLLDNDGNPTDTVSVIDLRGESPNTTTYALEAPALDGGLLDTVRYADTMDFTADGTALVYDALNEIELADGSNVSAWSIFALDLASGHSLPLVPPSAGLDVANPALSQRSDGFITFDVYDEDAGSSTVMAGNLTTGDYATVATVSNGYGVPGYTGDDAAIVYSQASNTDTEFSLMRQPLASDRMTPTGAPTLWLADADYGVIYRRGPFIGPGACPGDCDGGGETTINELIRGVTIALGKATLDACEASDSDRDGQVTIADLIRAVNAALSGCENVIGRAPGPTPSPSAQ